MKFNSYSNNFCSKCNIQIELLFTKDVEIPIPFTIITKKNGFNC